VCPSLTNRPGVAQAHENTKRGVTDGDRYMAARVGINNLRGAAEPRTRPGFLGVNSSQLVCWNFPTPGMFD
jgi:hypothetical protein